VAKLRLLIDALSGLAKMASEGLVHGDICPSNLLIFGGRDQLQWRLKLADFGESCAYRSLEDAPRCYAASGGSAYYLAPEAVFKDPIWRPKRDVWSLGVVLYAMLFGRIPRDLEEIFNLYFQGHILTDRELYNALRDQFEIRQDRNFLRLMEEDPKLAGLLAGMLAPEQYRRYSAADALEIARFLERDTRRHERKRRRRFWSFGRERTDDASGFALPPAARRERGTFRT